MSGLKAQLRRKLYECGRDPLSLFLLGCVATAAADDLFSTELFTGLYPVAGPSEYRGEPVCPAL